MKPQTSIKIVWRTEIWNWQVYIDHYNREPPANRMPLHCWVIDLGNTYNKKKMFLCILEFKMRMSLFVSCGLLQSKNRLQFWKAFFISLSVKCLKYEFSMLLFFVDFLL